MPNTWNKLIASLPNAHMLQTTQWAEVKTRYGWNSIFAGWSKGGQLFTSQDSPPASLPEPAAAGLILKRSLPVGGFARRMCVLYIPKGPLMDWGDAALRTQVLDGLQALARQHGAVFIKIDPDVWMGTGIPGEESAGEDAVGTATSKELSARGWVPSHDQIQFRNTILIDLQPPEEELLARMKQKTRYNIRLAEKKGVSVRPGTPKDTHLLYQMYAETSVRDGFVIRDEGYYQKVWQTFMPVSEGEPQRMENPLAEPLIAEVEGEPVAAIVIFRFAGRAWYLYGMSREAHREKMPNYLLQWEAMRRAKAAGCSVYDLWGAPDAFTEEDPLWGVYRFKEGLGGRVFRGLGAWDYTPNILLYRLYTKTLPRILDIMRGRGRTRTRQSLDN